MATAYAVNVTALLAGVDPAQLGADLVDPRAAVTALLAGLPAPDAKRAAAGPKTPICRRAA